MLNISQVILVRTDSNLCRKELKVHWSAPNSLIRSYLQPCTNTMWGGWKWSCGSHYLIIPDCGCPKGGSFLSRSSHNSPELWLTENLQKGSIWGAIYKSLLLNYNGISDIIQIAVELTHDVKHCIYCHQNVFSTTSTFFKWINGTVGPRLLSFLFLLRSVIRCFSKHQSMIAKKDTSLLINLFSLFYIYYAPLFVN